MTEKFTTKNTKGTKERNVGLPECCGSAGRVPWPGGTGYSFEFFVSFVVEK